MIILIIFAFKSLIWENYTIFAIKKGWKEVPEREKHKEPIQIISDPESSDYEFVVE